MRCTCPSGASSTSPRSAQRSWNRKLFLHKGSFKKFRGYAFQQMKKIKAKTNSSNPKRAATIEKFGYDTKFAYHIVRLALEAEQILMEHTLDLERNSQMLIDIRKGVDARAYREWFNGKQRGAVELYTTSTLRHWGPDEEAIKQLLLNCLEMHYGDARAAVTGRGQGSQGARRYSAILDRVGV
jgi:hypothetical protein